VSPWKGLVQSLWNQPSNDWNWIKCHGVKWILRMLKCYILRTEEIHVEVGLRQNVRRVKQWICRTFFGGCLCIFSWSQWECPQRPSGQSLMVWPRGRELAGFVVCVYPTWAGPIQLSLPNSWGQLIIQSSHVFWSCSGCHSEGKYPILPFLVGGQNSPPQKKQQIYILSIKLYHGTLQ
jgi:hypothetical protein